jgi:hypothetical protein
MEKFNACASLMAHSSNIFEPKFLLGFLFFVCTLNHAHKTKPSGLGEKEIS